MYIYVYVETVYGDIPPVYIFIHTHACTYTYTYVCIHIHIYMDIYICVYIHIYIQISSPYPKLLPHQLPGPRAAGAASTRTSQATPGRTNCHQVSHEKYLC